jgi:hypothetical protein
MGQENVDPFVFGSGIYQIPEMPKIVVNALIKAAKWSECHIL